MGLWAKLACIVTEIWFADVTMEIVNLCYNQ